MLRRFFASLFIILGIVLSPLRATAAMIPMLIVHDTGARSPTTGIGAALQVLRVARDRRRIRPRWSLRRVRRHDEPVRHPRRTSHPWV